jgi:quercetin dioxygenase-like cupin family protein
MAHEGQELEGPNGVRLRFVRITDEVLEMEQTYGEEGSLPPPHLHPAQDERFEVLDGAVRAVIGETDRRYEAGEVFEVPAGTTHQMGGGGAARVKWEVRPALRSAEFFEELYTGAAAADPAAFLERYAGEFRLVTPT